MGKSIKGNFIVVFIRVIKIFWGGFKVRCGMLVMVLFMCEIYFLKCMLLKMIIYYYFSKVVSLNILICLERM